MGSVGSYLPSLFGFWPPPPPPRRPCYGTRSQACLILVNEKNVRQPLLPPSLRKAHPCIVFAQNTHRNSGKFNWKFEKKILSHAHRFSDPSKLHNIKKNKE